LKIDSNTWRTVPLSEIADINPRLGKTALSDEEQFSFVPMASVGAADGSIDVSAKRPYAEVKKGFTPFQSGDVLFAKITPCMENGKMAVVPDLENSYGFGSTEFHVIRTKDGNDQKYVYYFVSGQGFRKEAAHHMTGAVGQKRVPTDFLKQSVISLPPTFEDQQQIVAEIEKLFSRLDEAVASLKRIQANLKRYKAAVLKAAVEGKLTEQWCKDHPDVEPADQLLKRILTERRAKWEAEELAKMKAKGIEPKDDSWKKKYKEPAGPDTANLPELPEGWVWASLDQLTSKITDGEHISPQTTEIGVPLLSAKDVQDYGVIFSDSKYVSPEDADKFRTRCDPENSDILIVSRGATIGRTCQVKSDVCFCLMGSVILAKTLATYESRYLSASLKSMTSQKAMLAVSGSTAQQAIYIRDIRSLPVPMPSAAEQNYMVEEIDRRLSVTEELETTIETNIKRAERLRQTILQQAFSGGLVSPRI